MLTALASLGVHHQPDFYPELAMAIPDVDGQLSRTPTSAQTLVRYAPALVITKISGRAELEPELVHAARTARMEDRQRLIEVLAENGVRP